METTFENHGPSKRFQIMVVDDEPINLKIVVRILSTFQYEVTSFDDVFEALNILREQREKFDLLLIEICLIGLKNFDMIKHLVEELELPIITMCAYDDEKIQHELLHHGVFLHLKKPITITDLGVVSQKAWKKKHEEEKSTRTIISSREKGILTKQSKSNYAILSSLDNSKREANQAKDGSSEKSKSIWRQQEASGSNKLSKISTEWDSNVQQRFLIATALVGEHAPPSKIHEVIGVKDLTMKQVSRHLQRHRKHLRRVERLTKIHPQREIRPRPSFSQPIFPLFIRAPDPPMHWSGCIYPASYLRPSLGGSMVAFPNYCQLTPGQWSGSGIASSNQLSYPNFYMGISPSRNQLSDCSHHAKPEWTSSTRTTPHQYIVEPSRGNLTDRQTSDIGKSIGPYGASSMGTNLSGLDNLTQDQPFHTTYEPIVPEASLDSQQLECLSADNQFNKNFGFSVRDDSNLERENDTADNLAFLMDEPQSTVVIAEESSLAVDDDDILDVGNFIFDEAAITKFLEDITNENESKP